MCGAAKHARSQSKAIRPEAVNKVINSRYVDSNKGSFDNYPSANTTWRRNQLAQTSVQNRQQNYRMVHPASSAGSRVTLTEYFKQMGRPASYVANQIISRKFERDKNVKANMCDRSNPDSRTHHLLGDSSEDG